MSVSLQQMPLAFLMAAAGMMLALGLLMLELLARNSASPAADKCDRECASSCWETVGEITWMKEKVGEITWMKETPGQSARCNRTTPTSLQKGEENKDHELDAQPILDLDRYVAGADHGYNAPCCTEVSSGCGKRILSGYHGTVRMSFGFRWFKLYQRRWF
ncbi:hypothetical protein ACOMHN_000361 [Nucella lapillus]